MTHPIQFITDLQMNVFCRLSPSKIHGVGVFAICTIPEGVNPFQETRPSDFLEVPKEMMDAAVLTSAQRQLVKDFCPERPDDGVWDCPSFSLNEIGIAWYLNHSPTPNMREDDGVFFTLRDIAEGEEMTVDYGTYGALNL